MFLEVASLLKHGGKRKVLISLLLTGAGEEIRTLDPNLGKVMLYPWATPASVSEAEVALEAFPCKG